jgi:hypothetical protein
MYCSQIKLKVKLKEVRNHGKQKYQLYESFGEPNPTYFVRSRVVKLEAKGWSEDKISQIFKFQHIAWIIDKLF